MVLNRKSHDNCNYIMTPSSLEAVIGRYSIIYSGTASHAIVNIFDIEHCTYGSCTIRNIFRVDGHGFIDIKISRTQRANKCLEKIGDWSQTLALEREQVPTFFSRRLNR
jgi:hypothetical protein